MNNRQRSGNVGYWSGQKAAGTLSEIFGESVAVLDIETTGVNPVRDRIIEVAIIRIENERRREWSSLVRPEHGTFIPRNVVNLTGISPSMLEEAPSSKEIFPKCLDLLTNASIIVGHHISFDLKFLRLELKRINRSVPHLRRVCTLHLARTLRDREWRNSVEQHTELSRLQNLSLSSVSRVLKIKHAHCHRALSDARTTELVAAKLVPMAIAAGMRV